MLDSTGATVIDNDFDNRLSGDSSNYGNFVRGTPKTRLGQATLRGDASYLLQCDSEPEFGEPKDNEINRYGRTRFRGSIGALGRVGGWTAGWFTTYYGPYVGTTTPASTEEVYDALRQPENISVCRDSGGVMRYRYLVTAFASHNAYLNNAFGR